MVAFDDVDMRIGELARRAGVGVSTLRAWERRFGLLEPNRSSGRQRLYTEDDLERICAVRRLAAEGLTLSAAVARVSAAGTQAVPTDASEAAVLRHIMQAADDGIWVSREGRTQFVNRRMAELMHCSADELLARSVLDFIDPQSVPLVRKWGELGRAGSRHRDEIELRRADGSTFLAEVTTSPMHDQAGRYEGAVAVVRDVTARNAIEREARFRAALLDAVGEAVTAARPDGTIVYVNAAAERLFGWRASDVIGKDGLALFPAPAASDDAQQIHSKLVRGMHHSGRMRLSRRDGTEFVAYMTSAPVFGDGDKLIGVMGVFTDLTETIALDNALESRELQLETVALLGAHAVRRALGAGPGPDSVVMEALEAIRRVLEVDYATLMEFTPDGAELVTRCVSPHSDERFVVPAGSRSLAGYTALARRVVLVTDASTDRRFDPCVGQENSASGSAVAAPVFGAVGVRAVLLAEKSTAYTFDQSAVHFMQCMANVIGAALQ
jgi:PAS domain S-box-containing protein